MSIENDINFFDINYWIDENYLFKQYSKSSKDTLEHLIKRKEQKNIHHTLLSNFLSYFYNAKAGNKLTTKLISKPEFLKAGALGVLFMEQDYFFNPRGFESWLKTSYENGFRLLKILPKTHKYPFESNLFSYFYEVLDSCNFPLMINIEELDITGNKNIEWDKIVDIANIFENIPIILEGGQSKELMYNSYLLLLLNNTSNIYIETHNLLGFNQIEDLIASSGENRLVFGSGYPFFSDELALSRIINSDIDKKIKNKIAYFNIKNIIDNIVI